VLLVLSPETVRWPDATDELRWIEDEESWSVALRRKGAGAGARVDVPRCGSSAVDEFALELVMLVSFAPCLERGGGGGDFSVAKGSLVLGAGLGGVASTECCEPRVNDELLRALVEVIVVRN